jgi:REP element-mobilizing transposase RayT
MPRKLGVEYPGAIYHVINRGNQRGNIFKDDQDRQRLLGTLGEACAKTEWQIHAWCLMRNHFHLVIETPEANLVDGSGTGYRQTESVQARLALSSNSVTRNDKNILQSFFAELTGVL